MKTRLSLLTVVLLTILAGPSPAVPPGTAFIYQGLLSNGAGLADNLYEFQFSLYDSVTNGSLIGTPANVAPVPVSNGLFLVTLDFGPTAFTGAPRWLEITLSVYGSDMVPVTLHPRQPVTPAPYALHALNAAGLMSLGTGPLDIIVNGQRALRLEPNAIEAPNVIAGSWVNQVDTGVLGATIAGGGAPTYNIDYTSTNRVQAGFAAIGGGEGNLIEPEGYDSVIAGGLGNRVNADISTIGGGGWNTIQSVASQSTISGGANSSIQTNASSATISGGGDHLIGPFAIGASIGGGNGNRIEFGAAYGVISGGSFNRVDTNAFFATVSGGEQNWVMPEAAHATIGGGYLNLIEGGAPHATVAGGENNIAGDDYATVGGGGFNCASGFAATVAGGGGFLQEPDGNSAAGPWSAVGGGRANGAAGEFAVVAGGENNLADGRYATVPGGLANRAQGQFSFAAGENTHAEHDGTFVWADASFSGVLRSTTTNQFTARASGGVRFFSDAGASTGVELPAGGNAWSVLSDQNAKENLAPVNCRDVLDKLKTLPVTTWNLKSQNAQTRHLGPMAQDFHAAFGVGEDDRHISTSDADGVALAAIKGLHELVREKDAEIQALKQRLDVLETLLNCSTLKGKAAP